MSDWRTFFDLPADAGARELKRAYAKLLKQYHPEDDPQGFQTLRQHYEAAQQALSAAAATNAEEQTQAGSRLSEPAPAPAQTVAAAMPWEADIAGILQALKDQREQDAIQRLDQFVQQYDHNLQAEDMLQWELFAWLDGQNDKALWPAGFVHHLVQTLALHEVAGRDDVMANRLQLYARRDHRQESGLSDGDYLHLLNREQKVQQAMVQIHRVWQQQGEQAALETVNDFARQHLFTAPLSRKIFAGRLLRELDDYFPGPLPLQLAKSLNEHLDIIALRKQWPQEYQHYERRLQAAEITQRYQTLLNPASRSAEALVWKSLYGITRLQKFAFYNPFEVFEQLGMAENAVLECEEEFIQFELPDRRAWDDVQAWRESFMAGDLNTLALTEFDFQALAARLKKILLITLLVGLLNGLLAAGMVAVGGSWQTNWWPAVFPAMGMGLYLAFKSSLYLWLRYGYRPVKIFRLALKSRPRARLAFFVLMALLSVLALQGNEIMARVVSVVLLLAWVAYAHYEQPYRSLAAGFIIGIQLYSSEFFASFLACVAVATLWSEMIRIGLNYQMLERGISWQMKTRTAYIVLTVLLGFLVRFVVDQFH
ncbi:MAG: hypothetical protein CMH98_05875 [Oceanospirillaceae bacterium]|nr:hypothetical protein [Oceanospirillaceae bacterium]